jgi:hypothetical protein
MQSLIHAKDFQTQHELGSPKMSLLFILDETEAKQLSEHNKI